MSLASRAASAPARCAMAVMAKASAPGRTKTRLVPPLTHEDAARANTAFLRDIAANMMEAARHCSLAATMAYGPPGPASAGFFAGLLPPDIGLVECWHPNFGDCLMAALAALFARGHESACVVNSDSPTLPTAYLVEAAAALAQPGDRAVLGPATDGGYYLLGLKRLHRRLFEDITWSTAAVAAETRARAAEIGLEVHILPPWYDVDDAAALDRLQADLFEADLFEQPGPPCFPAPASKAWLTGLRTDGGRYGRREAARDVVRPDPTPVATPA